MKREPHWVKLFFRELARTGNVRLAAERAGVDFSTAYGRRRRHWDFAERWKGALREWLTPSGPGRAEAISTASPAPPPLGVAERSSPPCPPQRAQGGAETIVRPDGKVVKASEARWTARKEEAFLVELADSANVKRAARAAGVSTTAVYKRRMKDGRFAAAWDLAVEAGKARLQAYLIELSDRTFDPDSLPLPDGQPKVSVSEAVSILRLKGAAAPAADARAEAGPVNSELKEAHDRIMARLERLKERIGRERAAAGWTEWEGEWIPPGWVRADAG